MSVGNHIAQATLSLYHHYESTRAGIMAIQESHKKTAIKTKLGEVAARL